MRNVKVALGVLFGILVFLGMDYILPSRDTVRITNVYNQLTDLGANSIFYASADTGTVASADGRRDIRFIATVRPGGKPYVFRNEDTGWIWPPYFKYDSANLHAVASDQVSNEATPKWVSITSYGWRVAAFSIYPNAVSIRPVAGPNERPLNWPALVVLGVIGALLLLLWRMWAQLRERAIDPAVARVDARADAVRGRVSTEAAEARGRWQGWIRSWRGTPRR